VPGAPQAVTRTVSARTAARAYNRGVAGGRLLRDAAARVPVSVKAPVKRAVPPRLRRYVDADWHRADDPAWEDVGRARLGVLRTHGLEPTDDFLELGCGALRSGVPVIRYLDVGRYVGVDRDAELLRQARAVEIPRNGLAGKRPTLVATARFELEPIGRRFALAFAPSLFAYLTLNEVIRCLRSVEAVLEPGGSFLAGFFENPAGRRSVDPVLQAPSVVSHLDREWFHYDVETLRWACEGTPLEADYLGPWGDPKNRKLIRFTRS